jgi:uncharacterized integral membrane protein
MNNDNPNQPPVGPSNQPDWRELRRQEREQRRAYRHSGWGVWWGGAILILLGIVFLLQNFGALALNNWWALFILIPAIGAFGAAWRSFQAAGGRLTAPARGSLIGGLVMAAISFAFLFNLDGRVFWPVLVILGGVGVLLNALLPS